jgi:hypothetical protein
MKEDTMKRILWFLTAIGVALVAGAVLLADQGAGKAAEEAAGKAADEAAGGWLAPVDSGEYAKSRAQASALFRKQVTAEQWGQAARAARGPLGRLVSRKLASTQFSKTLPGARDGEYVVLQFTSAFEEKREAAETVVMLKEEDGSWKTAGYFIK